MSLMLSKMEATSSPDQNFSVISRLIVRRGQRAKLHHAQENIKLISFSRFLILFLMPLLLRKSVLS